jgi:hypothetical protein
MSLFTVLAWIACAVVAYATHTLGILLIWSIPVVVFSVGSHLAVRLFYT